MSTILTSVPTDDYKEYLKSLNDFDTLNKLHWDTKRQVYSDYGLHTSSVKLVTDRDANPPVKIRKVMKEPRLKFVDSFGYVNLFPFLMKLLPPDSLQLEATLTRINNESLLWTDYGLRSLSKSDPFYIAEKSD
uniref:mannosyl-oligosaccharide glucosidase n=1 Tax=Amphimedon queenslandica TaxID=400682 RepID=A0A1X7SNM9_AMPQE